MIDRVVDIYKKAASGLHSNDQPWYKQPWFVILIVLTGLCLGWYLWYLKRQVSRLKAKNKLAKHRHMKARRDAKFAAHAAKRKELKRKAKEADEEQKRIDKKLTRMQDIRSKIDRSIDEATTVEDLRAKQKRIEQKNQE